MLGNPKFKGEQILLQPGDSIHLLLPSGRELEVEVTYDTASVTIYNTKTEIGRSNSVYVLFNEDLIDWEYQVTHPQKLVGLI